MRAIAIIVCALLIGSPASLLVASPAGAQSVEQAFPRMPHRGECIKLTKQIIRYAGDVDRARARGNVQWERATIAHIDRLALRRRDLCPQLTAREDPALRFIGRVLGLAALGALKYYTAGLF